MADVSRKIAPELAEQVRKLAIKHGFTAEAADELIAQGPKAVQEFFQTAKEIELDEMSNKFGVSKEKMTGVVSEILTPETLNILKRRTSKKE